MEGNDMENGTRSSKRNKKVNSSLKGTWIVGGTTLLGLGVGFVLLPLSALYFVASLLVGIGLGLVIAPMVSRK
jgi:uncharacterized membrane protein YdfJ with MMPL/SSD domain